MGHQWTDGEGGRWLVQAEDQAVAKGIPDLGTSIISFHSLHRSGNYAIETWELRDPSDIPDEDLQELLDRARELRG